MVMWPLCNQYITSPTGTVCSQEPQEDGSLSPESISFTKHMCFYRQLWKTVNKYVCQETSVQTNKLCGIPSALVNDFFILEKVVGDRRN